MEGVGQTATFASIAVSIVWAESRISYSPLSVNNTD